MKLMLAIIAIPFLAMATTDSCSHNIKIQPKKLKALNVLRKLDGRHKVGKCLIEAHICQFNENSSDREDPVVGDILMKNEYGEELYVQFVLPDSSIPGQKFLYLYNNHSFYYEFKNLIPENVFGRLEHTTFEIIFEPDATTLKSVILGTYNSILGKNRSEGNKYSWANCNAK